MRKGQAALEYFVMISLALLIATPLIMQSQGALQDVQDRNREARMQQALDAIEQGIKIAASQGQPARLSFTVSIPRGVVQTNITDQYIHYRMQTTAGESSFFRTFDTPVNGSLPEQQGKYLLRVEAIGSYVNVSVSE
ncbi:MAG: hypothetical protein MUP66_02250 [Candidatus Nanohaloarchaeota archaeon QJJ-5]|nr:hypothetical protein [Candidatus Nanohaloarchaeota archaeon QJJ-5]